MRRMEGKMWRVGRKVGRTVYDGDRLIGMMDTPAQAALVVDAVNRHRRQCEEEGRIYPCDECGVLRTKGEGGTTFTVCDECWDKLHPGPRP